MRCNNKKLKLIRLSEDKYKIVVKSERMKKEKTITVNLKFHYKKIEESYNFKIHLLPAPLTTFEEFATKSKNLALSQKKEIFFLAPRKYEKISLQGLNNKIFVAINKNVVIDFLELKNCNQLSFNGISFGNYKSEKESTIVKIDSSTRNVEFMNCIFRTIDSVENLSKDNWKTRIASGVISHGQRVKFTNNTFFNVFHALEINGDNCLINGNIIYSFSGDGIRNTGNSNTFDSNCIFNATVDDYYEPGGNHDDLFQSWTFGKPISEIVLKNNICISCLDENLKHKSKIVQGIVCFDGFEDNWLISNNLVITDHPHGIALFGTENCTIENNKVIRNPLKIADFESNPWIMISPHKDGRTSLNNTVKNNYSHTYKLSGSIIDSTGNKIINDTNIFEDYNNWDFKIKKLSQSQ
jgi:parallel beta-helix repeat protein